ncbi:MAG: peptidylprolyl isomerase [Candidatus Cloacimonadales bacterium]|nr:peptidylprolyl isomerase [Candidatus Cloacimonadales bacterium]
MIIAIVNDYQISTKEYKAELNVVMSKMKLEEPTEEAKSRAVEQLIDGYLLLLEAKNSDIDINAEMIENEFVEIMLKYDSKEEFDEMLAIHNLNYETIKDRLHNDLLVKEYIQRQFPPTDDIPMDKLSDIYVNNKEAFVTQEMVKASHILIQGEDKESLQKILEIRNSISCAEDFLALAGEHSQCPSHCTCGELGYITRGKMVKEFDDVAFNLSLNEISEPVKTPFGYHLIMITDRKNSKIAAFEEVKDALQKRLQQIDCELQLIRHLKKLRSSAEIFIKHDKL